MSIQEKDLVKQEKESCNSGACSTSAEDKAVVAKQAEELKKALEQKAQAHKSTGCCG